MTKRRQTKGSRHAHTHTRGQWRPTWTRKRKSRKHLYQRAKQWQRDTFKRMAERAFMAVLGYVPAYKPGQGPDNRAMRTKLNKLSKAKTRPKVEKTFDIVAARPKKSTRSKAGVGSNGAGDP